VLSSEVLDSGGVYLMDNGADLLVYVDHEAPDQIVQVRLLASGQAGRQPCGPATLCLNHSWALVQSRQHTLT
jgi:hypothetical protein